MIYYLPYKNLSRIKKKVAKNYKNNTHVLTWSAAIILLVVIDSSSLGSPWVGEVWIDMRQSYNGVSS